MPTCGGENDRKLLEPTVTPPKEEVSDMFDTPIDAPASHSTEPSVTLSTPRAATHGTGSDSASRGQNGLDPLGPSSDEGHSRLIRDSVSTPETLVPEANDPKAHSGPYEVRAVEKKSLGDSSGGTKTSEASSGDQSAGVYEDPDGGFDEVAEDTASVEGPRDYLTSVMRRIVTPFTAIKSAGPLTRSIQSAPEGVEELLRPLPDDGELSMRSTNESRAETLFVPTAHSNLLEKSCFTQLYRNPLVEDVFLMKRTKTSTLDVSIIIGVFDLTVIFYAIGLKLDLWMFIWYWAFAVITMSLAVINAITTFIWWSPTTGAQLLRRVRVYETTAIIATYVLSIFLLETYPGNYGSCITATVKAGKTRGIAERFCFTKFQAYASFVKVCPLFLYRVRGTLVIPAMYIGSFALLIGRAIGPQDGDENFALTAVFETLQATVFVIALWISSRHDRRRFEEWVLLERQTHRLVVQRREIDDILKGLLPLSMLNKLARNLSPVECSPHCTVGAFKIHEFAKWSATILPAVTVQIIDALHTIFDQFAATGRYPLSKIKACGDYYVVAQALNRKHKADPNSVLGFAKWQIATTMRLRRVVNVNGVVAVHIGACAGGILGMETLAYEVFGPAVDIAIQLADCTARPNVVHLTQDVIVACGKLRVTKAEPSVQIVRHSVGGALSIARRVDQDPSDSTHLPIALPVDPEASANSSGSGGKNSSFTGFAAHESTYYLDKRGKIVESSDFMVSKTSAGHSFSTLYLSADSQTQLADSAVTISLPSSASDVNDPSQNSKERAAEDKQTRSRYRLLSDRVKRRNAQRQQHGKNQQLSVSLDIDVHQGLVEARAVLRQGHEVVVSDKCCANVWAELSDPLRRITEAFELNYSVHRRLLADTTRSSAEAAPVLLLLNGIILFIAGVNGTVTISGSISLIISILIVVSWLALRTKCPPHQEVDPATFKRRHFLFLVITFVMYLLPIPAVGMLDLSVLNGRPGYLAIILSAMCMWQLQDTHWFWGELLVTFIFIEVVLFSLSFGISPQIVFGYLCVWAYSVFAVYEYHRRRVDMLSTLASIEVVRAAAGNEFALQRGLLEMLMPEKLVTAVEEKLLGTRTHATLNHRDVCLCMVRFEEFSSMIDTSKGEDALSKVEALLADLEAICNPFASLVDKVSFFGDCVTLVGPLRDRKEIDMAAASRALATLGKTKRTADDDDLLLTAHFAVLDIISQICRKFTERGVTIIATTDTVFSALFGRHRPTFSIVGAAVRSATELMRAATPGTKVISSKFLRIVDGGHIVLPRHEGDISVGAGHRWRVQGAGFVTMHAIELAGRK